MDTFDNYFRNLYDNPPKKYARLGHFGKSIWQDMVSEGLITSYPFDDLSKVLRNFDIPGADIEFDFKEDDSVGLSVTQTGYPERDIKSIVNDVNKKLNVYGYYVGRTVRRQYANDYRLIVEPRFPTPLTPAEISENPFYHVTHKKNWPKIKQIGLTPRSSQTVFTHPGGRTYLVQSPDHDELSIVNDVKDMLGKAKDRELDKQNKLYDLVVHAGPWEGSMIVMRVDIPAGMTVYKDPMMPSHTEEGELYRAVFVTGNIPPDNIILI